MIWKPAALALLVSLAIMSGLYFIQGQRLDRSNARNSALVAEVNQLGKANDTLNQRVKNLSAVNQTGNKKAREISKVIENDSTIADFLATPLPGGLRDALARTYH